MQSNPNQAKLDQALDEHAAFLTDQQRAFAKFVGDALAATWGSRCGDVSGKSSGDPQQDSPPFTPTP